MPNNLWEPWEARGSTLFMPSATSLLQLGYTFLFLHHRIQYQVRLIRQLMSEWEAWLTF